MSSRCRLARLSLLLEGKCHPDVVLRGHLSPSFSFDDESEKMHV